MYQRQSYVRRATADYITLCEIVNWLPTLARLRTPDRLRARAVRC